MLAGPGNATNNNISAKRGVFRATGILGVCGNP